MQVAYQNSDAADVINHAITLAHATGYGGTVSLGFQACLGTAE
jgi:hypothetical protein